MYGKKNQLNVRNVHQMIIIKVSDLRVFSNFSMNHYYSPTPTLVAQLQAHFATQERRIRCG